MRHRVALLRTILTCIVWLAACAGDEVVGLGSGSAEITIVTTGADSGPEAYTIRIDDQQPQAAGSSASVTVSDLSSGDHTVTLAGLSTNCSVLGQNPRPFTVVTGQTTAVQVQVACSSTTSIVAVEMITDGESLDPDGYLVASDGGDGQRVPTNGVTELPLPPGTHRLEVAEVAANCNVAAPNPQTVALAAGEMARTRFLIHCLPASAAKIAVASYVNFSSDIVVMNPDGSGRQNITNQPGLDLSPAWSPDGTTIAFVGGSGDVGSGDFESDIYTVHPDGSGRTKLTTAAYAGLAWSPDGGRILFSDQLPGGPQLFVIDSDGSNRRQLTFGPPISLSSFSWSPDSRRILIGRFEPSRIVVVNADGSGERDLIQPGDQQSDGGARWSPDGRTIAFLRWVAPPPDRYYGIQNLWVVEADGSNPRNVSGFTFDGDGYVGGYDWASDSDRLVFTSGLGSLTVVRKDGSDRNTTHRDDVSLDSPSWSPDGSKIMVLMSTAQLLRGVALINPDGTGLTRLSPADTYEESAVWQP
jgi:Tol biopolymer transport system component